MQLNFTSRQVTWLVSTVSGQNPASWLNLSVKCWRVGQQCVRLRLCTCACVCRPAGGINYSGGQGFPVTVAYFALLTSDWHTNLSHPQRAVAWVCVTDGQVQVQVPGLCLVRGASAKLLSLLIQTLCLCEELHDSEFRSLISLLWHM